MKNDFTRSPWTIDLDSIHDHAAASAVFFFAADIR